MKIIIYISMITVLVFPLVAKPAESVDEELRTLRGEGVLVNQGDRLGEDGGFKIYNKDNTVYGVFKSSEDKENIYFYKNNKIQRIKIHKFISIHKIAYFAANKIKEEENKYEVYVDGEWKYVYATHGYFFYPSWEKFLVDMAYLMPFDNEKIKIFDKLNGKLIGEYGNDDEIVYKVLKVKGDWVEIECNEAYSGGCGKNPGQYKGWVKWRIKDKVILDLIYAM